MFKGTERILFYSDVSIVVPMAIGFMVRRGLTVDNFLRSVYEFRILGLLGGEQDRFSKLKDSSLMLSKL